MLAPQQDRKPRIKQGFSDRNSDKLTAMIVRGANGAMAHSGQF
jgi:hypothetical protein